MRCSHASQSKQQYSAKNAMRNNKYAKQQEASAHTFWHKSQDDPQRFKKKVRSKVFGVKGVETLRSKARASDKVQTLHDPSTATPRALV